MKTALESLSHSSMDTHTQTNTQNGTRRGDTVLPTSTWRLKEFWRVWATKPDRVSKATNVNIYSLKHEFEVLEAE